MVSRPAAEETVRKTRYAKYPSKASIPKSVLEGEFDQAVRAYLAERWRQERTSFTAGDKSQMQQLRAMAELLNVGYVQVELENNYIRFQTKLLGNLR